MRLVRGALAFLYDFLVGEDLVLFVVAAAAIAATAVLATRGADPWWLVPVAVALGLAASIRRAAGEGRRGR